MKQFLPVLFLFVLLGSLPRSAYSAISFTIDNPVREGDYFIIDATLSGISSVSAYVQGVFTHTASPNYFGFTWGQKEDWVSYQSSTNKDFISQNFPIILKDSLQKIWIRPNFEDSSFKGSGDYFLKLRRYTGSGDSYAGESNVLTVYLIGPTAAPTESPTIAPTPTSEPTITLNPTKTPTPTPLKTPTATKAPTPSKSGTPTSVIPSAVEGSHSSSILGDSTSSALVIARSASDAAIQDPSLSSVQTSSSNTVFKYTFIFATIITTISGGLLYFRNRTD